MLVEVSIISGLVKKGVHTAQLQTLCLHNPLQESMFHREVSTREWGAFSRKGKNF